MGNMCISSIEVSPVFSFFVGVVNLQGKALIGEADHFLPQWLQTFCRILTGSKSFQVQSKPDMGPTLGPGRSGAYIRMGPLSVLTLEIPLVYK